MTVVGRGSGERLADRGARSCSGSCGRIPRLGRRGHAAEDRRWRSIAERWIRPRYAWSILLLAVPASASSHRAASRRPIVRAQLLQSLAHRPAALASRSSPRRSSMRDRPGPSTASADAALRRVARARGLVVGLAPHRDEQRRDAEPHQLVEGVVAGRRHGAVEGRVVAAHRDRSSAGARRPRGRRAGRRSPRTAAATCTPSRPASARRQRAAAPATSGPWPSCTRIVGLPGLEAQLALGLGARQELVVVEEDDRRRPRAPRRGGQLVGPRSSAGREARPARAPRRRGRCGSAGTGSPRASTAPRRHQTVGGTALHRGEQRVVGQDAVEDEHVRGRPPRSRRAAAPSAAATSASRCRRRGCRGTPCTRPGSPPRAPPAPPATA